MNKNNCLTFALCMVVSSVAFAGKEYNLTLQRKFARQEKAENQSNPESPFGKAEPKTVLEAREFKARQVLAEALQMNNLIFMFLLLQIERIEPRHDINCR